MNKKQKRSKRSSPRITAFDLKQIQDRVKRLTERTSAKSLMRAGELARDQCRSERESESHFGETALYMIAWQTSIQNELICILGELIALMKQGRGEGKSLK